MSNQSLGNRVQEDLTQAVASELLPEDVQQRAIQLLERLRKPVRLGIMGFPGSGKSTLLNLLIGADVLKENVQLPTLQLTYNDVAESICTLSDGSKTTLASTDAHEIAELSPVFVEMRMALPALTKISVLEIVTPDDATSLHRATQWAAKRCDVALWCSQGFNQTEQSIWGQMPDLIKDHSFLMLTKADFLQANGIMDSTMDAVRAVAVDEFTQILPIATQQALAARRPDGTVDKAIMRASGGLSLISSVLKQVEQGRQSAVDMADILLHQHAELLKAPAPKAETPVTAEPSLPVEPESVDSSADEIETAIASTVAKAETPKPAVDPAKTRAEEPLAAQQESDVVVLLPATRVAYENALQYIMTESRALLDLAEKMGDAAPAKIIAKAVEHVQWLSEYLNENGDDADPLLIQARDAALDAADLVQLMQMEKRDSAAIEALSLLLQLKHELQADLAA